MLLNQLLYHKEHSTTQMFSPQYYEAEWTKLWFQELDNPDYESLSSSPNLTWAFVQQNPDKPWSYGNVYSNNGLSRNPNITWEIVQQNPDKPWNYYRLSQNPNITWEIVQQNPEKPWFYGGLSENPNITWEIVQQNPEKPWCYRGLSNNPNITREIVQQNPDKPWSPMGFINNTNISWEPNPEVLHHKLWIYKRRFHLLNLRIAIEKQKFILRRRKEDFIKSDFGRELIAYQFHPRNMDKWKGWGIE